MQAGVPLKLRLHGTKVGLNCEDASSLGYFNQSNGHGARVHTTFNQKTGTWLDKGLTDVSAMTRTNQDMKLVAGIGVDQGVLRLPQWNYRVHR